MNTIFLDIDGVLNSHRSMIAAKIQRPIEGYVSYTERHYTELDPVAINLLRTIVHETKAEIVISSSWRKLYDDVNFFKRVFTKFNWHNAPIVGMTPIVDSGFRGQEVQQYIDCNDFFTGPYIIFDDDGDFYDHQPLIKTDAKVGLSADNFETAMIMLGGQEIDTMLGCVER